MLTRLYLPSIQNDLRTQENAQIIFDTSYKVRDSIWHEIVDSIFPQFEFMVKRQFNQDRKRCLLS